MGGLDVANGDTLLRVRGSTLVVVGHSSQSPRSSGGCGGAR